MYSMDERISSAGSSHNRPLASYGSSIYSVATSAMNRPTAALMPIAPHIMLTIMLFESVVIFRAFILTSPGSTQIVRYKFDEC